MSFPQIHYVPMSTTFTQATGSSEGFTSLSIVSPPGSADNHRAVAEARAADIVHMMQPERKPEAAELMPHLLNPRLSSEYDLGIVPLCSNFPASRPGPNLGMAHDTPFSSFGPTHRSLELLGMSVDDARAQALRNLDAKTPKVIRSASIRKYKPTKTDLSSLPAYINRLRGTNLLVVSFPDRFNSIRLMVPRVIDAMAAALSIPVTQLVVIALYERQFDTHAPLLAAACSDLSAILTAYDLAQGERCYQPMSVMDGRTAERVCMAPFIMQTISGSDSSTHKYEPKVYPGFGQPHALRLQHHTGDSGPAKGDLKAAKGVVYMPWPVTAAQRAALQENMPLTVQDMSSHSPWVYPLPQCCACYHCAKAIPAKSGKCGKCMTARYCDANCQHADFPKHRHFCKIRL